MAKKRLFFDMDNVLVDFKSGLDKVDEQTKQVILGMYANFDYEIKGASVVEENKVAVAVDITTTDFEVVLTEYFIEATKHLEEENWDADGSYFMELATSPDAAVNTFSTVAYVTNNGGQWDVDTESEENIDFFNALTGGAMSMLE